MAISTAPAVPWWRWFKIIPVFFIKFTILVIIIDEEMVRVVLPTIGAINITM